MNRQYSYNNFDYKYMHKSQLLPLLYIFLCGWVIDPKTRKPKRVNIGSRIDSNKNIKNIIKSVINIHEIIKMQKSKIINECH